VRGVAFPDESGKALASSGAMKFFAHLFGGRRKPGPPAPIGRRELTQVCRQLGFPRPKALAAAGGGRNRLAFESGGCSWMLQRFPKGRRTLEWEVRLIDHLTAHAELPVASPAYAVSGTNPAGMSHLVTRWLRGVNLHECSRATEGRVGDALAGSIGEALAELHAVPRQGFPPGLAGALPDLSIDAPRAALMARELLARAAADGWIGEAHLRELHRRLERALAFLPDSPQRVLVHGDISETNLLSEPGSDTLTGLVDFENAGWGDPGWDYAGLALARLRNVRVPQGPVWSVRVRRGEPVPDADFVWALLLIRRWADRATTRNNPGKLAAIGRWVWALAEEPAGDWFVGELWGRPVDERRNPNI